LKRRLTCSAYHEGGHALVALLTTGCDEVDKATVETAFP
jgi:ATP-dependent Zn protease